ncbi:unnamed protein product, partial [Ectocarpus fasciculatus]
MEERRRRNAENSFDQAMRASTVEVSKDILLALSDSLSADLRTGSVTEELLRVFRAFIDRSPRLCAALSTIEAALGPVLVDNITAGNESVTEHEKRSAMDTIASYIDDLHSALAALLQKLDSRVEDLRATRATGLDIRNYLISLLDDAITANSSLDDKDQILPMLTAMREEILTRGPLERDEQSVEDENAQKSEDFERGLQEEAVRAIEENENLSSEQREIILDKVEEDSRLLDNIIELEMKRQNEALEQAMLAAGPTAEQDDEDEIAKRHAEEHAALVENLKSKRAENLKNAMRGGSFSEYSSLNDPQVAKECMVMTLASTRIAVRLRGLGVLNRLKMSAILSELLCTDEFDIVDYSVDALRSKLALKKFDSIRGQVQEMVRDMTKAREIVEAEEDAIHEQWIQNIDNVKLNDELERLRIETSERYDSCKSEIIESSRSAVDKSISHSKICQQRASDRANRTTDEKIKAYIIEKSDREIAARKHAIEELYRSDISNLLAVQSQCEELMNLGLAWGPKVDKRAEVRQIHERIISGIHVRFDAKMRLGRNELKLRAEVHEMKQLTDLNRRGATQEEIEKLVARLQDMQASDETMFHSKIEALRVAAVKAERQRQEHSTFDYEKELILATEKNCISLGEAIEELLLSETQMMLEVAESLKVKQELIMKDLESKNVPDEILSLTVLKLVLEAERELCELKGDYSSLVSGRIIVERETSSMIEGLLPTFSMAQSIAEDSFCVEMCEFGQAIRADAERKTCKLKLCAIGLKENEANRLMLLGRAPEELVALFDSIDADTDVINKESIENSHSELKHIEILLLEQLEDKKKIQSDYEVACDAILRKHEKNVRDIRRQFDGQRSKLQSNEFSDSDETMASSVLKIDQGLAAALSRAIVAMQDELCEAFKVAMSRKASVEQVEDEIRDIRQHEQQESDAFENAVAADNSEKYKMLSEMHRERRNDVTIQRNQHERDIVGLEGQLAQSREKSKEFMEKRLKQRRQSLERALVASGVSPDTAAEMVNTRSVAYEQQQRKELEVKIAIDEQQKRASLKDSFSRQNAGLADFADRVLGSIALGYETHAENERLRLAETIKGRRAIREAELLGEGHNASEVSNILNDEFNTLESSDRDGLEAELDEFSVLVTTVTDEEEKSQLVQAHNRYTAGLNVVRQQLSSGKITKQQGDMQIDELKLKLKETENAITGHHQLVSQAFKGGMNALRITEAEQLQQVFDVEIADLAQRLQQENNFTPEAAKAEAESRLKETHDGKRSALHDTLGAVETYLKQSCQAVVDNKILAAQVNYDRAMHGHQAAVKKRLEQEEAILRNKFNNQTASRIAAKVRQGMSTESATDATAAELGNIEDRVKDLHNNIQRAEDEKLHHAETALAEARSVWEAGQDRLRTKEDTEAAELRKMVLQDLNEVVKSGANYSIAASTDTRLAVKGAREDIDNEGAELRKVFQATVDSITASLQQKREEQAERIHRDADRKVEDRVQELIKQNVSPETARATALAEIVPETESLLEDMEFALSKEERDLILAEKKALESKEKELLERCRVAAVDALKHANEDKVNAASRVDEIRKEHESQLKSLENRLSADQKAQEDALRARLKERARQQVLNGETPSPQKDAVELADLHQRQQYERFRSISELQKGQEKQLLQALKNARQRDRDAKAAQARESAIDSERSAITRAEDDRNKSEVQRLRDQNAKEEERSRSALEASRTQGKGRLQERLAQKRHIREQELKAE